MQRSRRTATSCRPHPHVAAAAPCAAAATILHLPAWPAVSGQQAPIQKKCQRCGRQGTHTATPIEQTCSEQARPLFRKLLPPLLPLQGKFSTLCSSRAPYQQLSCSPRPKTSRRRREKLPSGVKRSAPPAHTPNPPRCRHFSQISFCASLFAELTTRRHCKKILQFLASKTFIKAFPAPSTPGEKKRRLPFLYRVQSDSKKTQRLIAVSILFS
jgi:hypothetical protein